MQRLILFFLILSTFPTAWAVKLSDYKPFDYRVFFTNPVCRSYLYQQEVRSNDGDILTAKPKNVYCKANDYVLNYRRKASPHYQLVKLIEDENLKEISLAYLSFSNKQIGKALCQAITKRNVKVTFIMDSNNEVREGAREQLDQLAKCRPENSAVSAGEQANLPETYFRGNTRGLGYAHNKIIIAKYDDPTKVKIVFGSGNMSSGTILHHENWHFVTTNTDSYFAQAHECVIKGMVNHAQSKKEYKSFINKCRHSIRAEAEEDIQFFIVPSDGSQAMRTIVENVHKAEAVDVAAHRYYHPSLRSALQKAAGSKKVRLVVDDDIYWVGKLGRRVGSNMLQEYGYVNDLYRAGGEIYYMETNARASLLHHNKFVIFHFENNEGAIHTGAGNFTQAAFENNFENFYFIRIPKVYQAFKRQYEHVLFDLASSWGMMPQEYVNP